LQFAGAAQSLSGALRVNPWNTEELATAIHTALTLTPIERQIKHGKLYQYVSTHTAAYWAKTFLSEFKAIIQTKPEP
jgi:trehalose-6-phosphate synthase